jgi:hypothetical protein
MLAHDKCEIRKMIDAISQGTSIVVSISQALLKCLKKCRFQKIHINQVSANSAASSRGEANDVFVFKLIDFFKFRSRR